MRHAIENWDSMTGETGYTTNRQVDGGSDRLWSVSVRAVFLSRDEFFISSVLGDRARTMTSQRPDPETRSQGHHFPPVHRRHSRFGLQEEGRAATARLRRQLPSEPDRRSADAGSG